MNPENLEVQACVRLSLPIPSPTERVAIRVNGHELPAELSLPTGAKGLVIFIVGCGAIRETPHAASITRSIAAAGMGTLSLALLTEHEAQEDHQAGVWSFDLDLLTHRLLRVTNWAMHDPRTRGLGIGFCGTSIFAAAALVVASKLSSVVQGVVSRAGRPDFARESLPRVNAPTLLIVGEKDENLLELNRWALGFMGGRKQLTIVPSAGHLFEEPGAIERVGQLAGEWFAEHLDVLPADADDVR